MARGTIVMERSQCEINHTDIVKLSEAFCKAKDNTIAAEARTMLQDVIFTFHSGEQDLCSIKIAQLKALLRKDKK